MGIARLGHSFRQRGVDLLVFLGDLRLAACPTYFRYRVRRFGGLVFILGANTVIYFATGARMAGLWNANSSATERCSVVNPPAMREVPPEGAPSPSSSPRTR